jgi:glycosyltransferase involved in cell wall biosynthesis
MFEHPREHQFTVFIDRPAETEMQHPRVELVRVHSSRPVTEAAVATDNRSLLDILAFSRAAAARPMDVLFYPAVYSWFPAPHGLPNVLTLHDAIAERFPALVFPQRKRRWLWSAKTRLARWQATRIMTVSAAARAEVIEYLGIDPERIDVVTEAADARFAPVGDEHRRAAARARAGLPADKPMILYVGGLAPHKNLQGLLQGLAQASESVAAQQLQLALVGDPAGDGFHSHHKELVDTIQGDTRLQGRVHFAGFVPDEDLVALYSDALALALPSFSEGFGLPAMEAMACGVPVLASTGGSIPEVVGDAGLFFDPHHTAEIAAAIERIAGDPVLRAGLARKALSRAGEFSWKRAANQALDSLEKAAGR